MALPGLSKVLDRVAPTVLRMVKDVPVLRTGVSRITINRLAYSTTLRPRALSLASDYTSWRSLTDRTYSGRHLPPSTEAYRERLPAEADVVALFRRETLTEATDTSVMFMFFAQWFTDSFLRTDRENPGQKNKSNHEIDLCQIYGMDHARTQMLRAGQGGRLKSQLLGGEEYPAFLFQAREPGGPLVFKDEFAGLHEEDFIVGTILRSAPEEQKDAFFAVGLEHGNSTIGNTVMNVVFLREHNRVAGRLAAEHPDWDDDRLFETARNILIVLLLKLVVEEYIAHIAPYEFPFEVVKNIADGERWNRTNWCAIEFNLLYRWHSLVPDTIGDGSGKLTPVEFRNNNMLVVTEGVESLMTRCSTSRAGRIGLQNTPAFLVDATNPWPSVEAATVAQMRAARLQPYNAYRSAYGMDPVESFAQLTHDPALSARLEALYANVDDVEWYVGIFAEHYASQDMMGGLITNMVANDAFTQALTNPLLAREVHTAETFSSTGMKIIEETDTLQQIVARNSSSPDAVHVSFRC